jgi:hypothetical protein
MQPDHYSSAGISSNVKERPVLFTHNDTTGTRNDWASGTRKTLAQNFSFKFAKNCFSGLSKNLTN